VWQKILHVGFYKKKIISDTSSSPVLCGHPKELADKEGFDFYQRILKEDEWHWLMRMNVEAFNVFFHTSVTSRKDLVLSYEITFQTVNNHKFILHHKIVPYQLCDNGNLWLGLCFVSKSIRNKAGGVNMVDTLTGVRHDFTNETFVKVEKLRLTQEEVSILEWIARGISAADMCRVLKISLPTFKRKKRVMYKKIGVSTSAEAVYWANLKGII